MKLLPYSVYLNHFFIFYSFKYWFTAVPRDFTVQLLHAKVFFFCSDVSENFTAFPLFLLLLKMLNNIPLIPSFEPYMIAQIIDGLSESHYFVPMYLLQLKDFSPISNLSFKAVLYSGHHYLI